jgi:hypothetical protein
MTLSMITLFITAILVFFIAASLPPGLRELSESAEPLSYGFQTFISSISDNEV